MKILILLRHGKSDWRADFAHDHERPLSDRGVRASRRMGRFLATAGPKPDRVISSTAVRTRSTAELVVGSAGWNLEIEQRRELYGTGPSGVLDVLRGLPPDPDRPDSCILLVGHEPTWSSLASLLIGGGHLAVKTATAAWIELAIPAWGEVASGTGELRMLLPPRTLDGWLDGG